MEINNSDYAIEVYGIWTDRSSNRLEKRRIGWVEKEVSRELANILDRTAVVGIPNIFFHGEGTPGLRFRVWIKRNREEEQKQYNRILECLLRERGASVAEVATSSGLTKSLIRNWLEKLSRDDIVTGSLMEFLSGYRVEKMKEGGRATYKAVADETKIYVRKRTERTEEEARADPMGAEIPDYVFDL